MACSTSSRGTTSSAAERARSRTGSTLSYPRGDPERVPSGLCFLKFGRLRRFSPRADGVRCSSPDPPSLGRPDRPAKIVRAAGPIRSVPRPGGDPRPGRRPRRCVRRAVGRPPFSAPAPPPCSERGASLLADERWEAMGGAREVFRDGPFQVVEERWRRPDGTEVVYRGVKSPSSSSPTVARSRCSGTSIRAPGFDFSSFRQARSSGTRPPVARHEGRWRKRPAGELRLTPLGRYHPNPHWGAFDGHVLLGERLRKVEPHPAGGESLRPVLLPVGDVYRSFHRGRFRAGSTIVGLTLAEPRLQALGRLPRDEPASRAPRAGRARARHRARSAGGLARSPAVGRGR
jgi:hypothetical protein